ncbi:MAG TPA: zinc ribbon domain-containing protein [archaeon]|nr:zinc ribbon domain-containing protein [archaeon]
MFCSNCGTQLETGAQVCPRCGVTTRANPVPLGSSQDPNAIISENPQAATNQVTSLIPLTDGERILWHKETTHGLVRKEVTMEEAVTNKRCLKYDAQTKNIVAQIGITHWPEVVIMNVHRVNDSLGGGVFLTPRMFGLPGLPFGVYGGPRRGNLKVFGDVSFLVEGKVVMTFENVKDPQGVRQLVEALKRQQGFQGPGRARPWMGQRFRPMQP